ncbi:hypothetical protein GCK72_000750 [Caenorhabditis remanei]|uniref:SPK domain-containing protein n=1 Tax=Caenorhabditis remanei TaxID=31234 RepID=A0A6A5HRI7_CAERE|nr:hypothetical protein GCK72_000750 [Caenorhabditis remanei]KAF1768937.1 hypothetical protein GCK72_000750 [Caenorhabditis remanei]
MDRLLDRPINEWPDDYWRMAWSIADFSKNALEPQTFYAISIDVLSKNEEIGCETGVIDKFVKSFAHLTHRFYPRIHPWLHAKIFFVCRTSLLDAEVEYFRTHAYLAVDQDNKILHYKQRVGLGEFGNPRMQVEGLDDPVDPAPTNGNVAGDNADQADGNPQQGNEVQNAGYDADAHLPAQGNNDIHHNEQNNENFLENQYQYTVDRQGGNSGTVPNDFSDQYFYEGSNENNHPSTSTSIPYHEAPSNNIQLKRQSVGQIGDGNESSDQPEISYPKKYRVVVLKEGNNTILGSNQEAMYDTPSTSSDIPGSGRYSKPTITSQNAQMQGFTSGTAGLNLRQQQLQERLVDSSNLRTNYEIPSANVPYFGKKSSQNTQLQRQGHTHGAADKPRILNLKRYAPNQSVVGNHANQYLNTHQQNIQTRIGDHEVNERGPSEPNREVNASNFSYMNIENYQEFMRYGETMTEFLNRLNEHRKAVGFKEAQIPSAVYMRVRLNSMSEKTGSRLQNPRRPILKYIPVTFETMSKAKLMTTPEFLRRTQRARNAALFIETTENLRPFFDALYFAVDGLSLTKTFANILSRIGEFIEYTEVKPIMAREGTTETSLKIVLHCVVCNAGEECKYGYTLKHVIGSLISGLSDMKTLDNFKDSCYLQIGKPDSKLKKISYPMVDTSFAEALNYAISVSNFENPKTRTS